MIHNFYVRSGNLTIYSGDDKAKVLRWAASYATNQSCLALVYKSNGDFIKSFDGR